MHTFRDKMHTDWHFVLYALCPGTSMWYARQLDSHLRLTGRLRDRDLQGDVRHQTVDTGISRTSHHSGFVLGQ